MDPIPFEPLRVDEQRRRDFEREKNTRETCQIEEFLPSEQDSEFLDTLVELVCLEFEYSWKRWAKKRCEPEKGSAAQPAMLEAFLDRFPEIRREDILAFLISEEFPRPMVKFGLRPSPEEYQHRFPGHHADLKSLLNELAVAPEYQANVAAPPGVDTTILFPAESTCNPDSGERTDADLNSTAELTSFARYSVQRLLGAGQFGEVYLATDEQLQRPVAVKVARIKVTSDSYVGSCLQEGQTAAKLDHPHIVPVYDVGALPDGRVFVVSKFIEGQDLERTVQQQRLPFAEVASLVAQVAEALHYAHTQGLVHRDIKPANILIDKSAVPFVTDFGLAVHEDYQRERAGEVAGTLPYMAPEQVRGESHRLDGRVDLWRLGAVLYELLTGRRPFQGNTVNTLTDEILHREAKPLRQIDDTIPIELERITLKCLSKHAMDRYSTCKDLADELRRLRLAAGDSNNVERLLLRDRYRLLDSSGVENGGTCFSARDIQSDDLVAVWIGDDPVGEIDVIRDHFLRHAEKVLSLRHPNATNLLDYGVLSDGRPMLVTEFVDGRSLEDHLTEGLDWDTRLSLASHYVSQVGRVLHAAHRLGLAHGAIKGDNIVRSRTTSGEERFVLTHFGLPGATSDGESTASASRLSSHRIFGNPVDLTPEQIDNGEVTHRTDIYQFAALLYRLLTGHRPFDPHSMNAIELVDAIRHETPPPISNFPEARWVPTEVDDLLRQCMSKDQADRPRSVLEVVAPLKSLVNCLPTSDAKPELDQDVQFTVYRPKVIEPERWYGMLAFAHCAELPEDAEPGTPDPIEEVKRQAEYFLHDQLADYRSVSQDSTHAIPREAVLTFVPDVAGVVFNPDRRSFSWTELVHREEFRLQANRRTNGRTLKGQMSVFLGNLLIAEVSLSIRVDASAVAGKNLSLASDRARRFRKIYAACVPEDAEVVGHLHQYALALGDDCVFQSAPTHSRSGNSLSDHVQSIIADSDVFQLFWSTNSMHSRFVRSEWEYAMSLGRNGFVKPVYWQRPIPSDPNHDLPPAVLRKLRFLRIGFEPDVAPEFALSDEAEESSCGISHFDPEMKEDEDVEFDSAVMSVKPPRKEDQTFCLPSSDSIDRQTRGAPAANSANRPTVSVSDRCRPRSSSWQRPDALESSQRPAASRPLLRAVMLALLAAVIWFAVQFLLHR